MENVNVQTAIMFEEARQRTIKMKKEYIAENQESWAEIGQKAKEYREAHGISVKQVSALTGYSITTINKFQSGLPVMNADKLQKAYNMAINSIINERKIDEKDRERAHLQNCVQMALRILDEHGLHMIVAESQKEHMNDDFEFLDGYGESCYNQLLKQIGLHLYRKEKMMNLVNAVA